jgi:ferredoxin
MSDHSIIRGDTDIWDRIRSRSLIEDESITVDLRRCTRCRFLDIDKSTIDRESPVLREGLRDDLRRGITSDMDHLGSCISLLSCIRECYPIVEGTRVISLEDRAWIEHGHS